VAEPRTLTEQQLNRALLARQQLLERGTGSVPKMLERMGTLQAQYAPSMYVGLWTRLEGFEREQLDRALEGRKVAQGTLMRATIHLVSAADYWPIALGVRKGRREAWLAASYRRDYSGKQMAAAARKLRSAIGDGTMRRKEIHELLGSDSVVTNGVNMWLDLVRVPPSGTWERRRADLYGLAADWLGPWQVDAADALEHLVRRYLAGFGPASLGDLGSWAGMPLTRLRPVLERVGTRRFRDERGAALFDLPRAPLPDPGTPAPPRFLSTWDANLLVHARRTQVLPEHHRPRIFHTRAPHSFPTFLVEGAVAGTWRHDQGRVRLEPFEPLPRATRRQLETEAERLAAFHQE
jgi:hypothetical protein